MHLKSLRCTPNQWNVHKYRSPPDVDIIISTTIMNECKVCHKTYANRQNLNRHMKSIHGLDTNEDQSTEDSATEESMGEDTVTDDESNNSVEEEEEYRASGAWKYIIAETIHAMGITTKQEVHDQFNEFLTKMREKTEHFVGLVSMLKQDVVYKQLKSEEARWLRRGFPCDEASTTAWKLRKIMIKKMVDHVFATVDQPTN